ncbi:MAG: tandem-95 repeat protein, partial [Alphaproteobacteria bacterium]|nr:tandem-95 repeat protein [Alphaproteobacteria bacterium]
MTRKFNPTLYRSPETTGGGGASAGVYVHATGDEVLLPPGFNPAEVDFVRAGPDLVMTTPDGEEVVVTDFFMQETPPTLVTDGGAHFDGDLVARLAGSPTPAQVAGTAGASEAIGRVVNIDGEVTITRADGTKVTLNEGDPVFLGDIVETAGDGGIGILLADGTSLAMGEDALMVLDEMVYDPSVQEGSIGLSVLRGVFTMVSGEIAKTDPEAMQVFTPMATIGIRGTQVGLDLGRGDVLNVVLMEEADGFVGEVIVSNAGGVFTLNQAFTGVQVLSFLTPPQALALASVESLVEQYGSALQVLPVEGTNANTYGQQEGAVPSGEAGREGLADFETAAGDENQEDEESLASFDTAAGPGVTADELEAETNVVFGDEVRPMDVTAGLDVVESEAVDVGGAPEPAPVGPEAVVTAETPVVVAVEPVNAPPVAEAGSAILAEDNVFSGQLQAADLEGGELVFSLATDGAPVNGTVVVNADGTFTYIPKTDFGGTDTFTYLVTDANGAVATATVTVTVTPVVDVPQVAAANVTGFEDGAVALTIAATMPADTTHTVASVVVTGVPSGAALSVGTDNGDGTWTLRPSQLSSLSLTPPKDFNGTLNLGVQAVSSDGGVATSSFSVNVAPVADTPQLAVADVTGAEDSSIMLTIATAMAGSTNETVESILLTGVPVGAALSAGTDNGDGTWTLMPSDLGGLTLT